MSSIYVPGIATIESVQDETPTEKTLSLRLVDGETISCVPGQFITLSVFGRGEAPFCVGTAGQDMPGLDITVRCYPGGQVTEALSRELMWGYAGRSAMALTLTPCTTRISCLWPVASVWCPSAH